MLIAPELPELIDTHAHLDSPQFCDRIPTVVERGRQAGVTQIVSIGVDIETSRKAARIAGENERVFAAAGIHPNDALPLDPEALRELEQIASQTKVVAVGEIGLDYFRDMQPRPVQRQCFRRQMEMAVKIGKPVIFHIRNGWEDFFELVGEFAPSLPPSVMHCFSGDWGIARKCLDLGFYLSIPGVVTFPNAQPLQDVAARAPLNRLLVETDSPYLAPVPYRGKTNEPAFVLHTARKVAQCRKQPLEIVAINTTQNARTVFGIPAPSKA